MPYNTEKAGILAFPRESASPPIPVGRGSRVSAEQLTLPPGHRSLCLASFPMLL